MNAYVGLLAAAMIVSSAPAGKSSDIARQLELHEMNATAYCVSGTTYTGTETRCGIAAASKDVIGSTAIVYQRLPNGEVGEVIGYYEIQDTGGSEGINSCNVIDIWCPNLDDCQVFMNRVYEDGCRGKVFVQFLEAKG